MRPSAHSFKRLIPARALALAAALGLVAALGVTAAPAVGSATKAGVAPCGSSGLVIWLNTQSNGAAGTIFYKLNFTNLSGKSCTLRGYPGVSAVTLAGKQLGSAASRNSATKVKTITLANGKTASANVGIVEAGNFTPSACKPTTAAGLKIFPPNQSKAKTVPFPFAACSGSGPKYLTIQALK